MKSNDKLRYLANRGIADNRREVEHFSQRVQDGAIEALDNSAKVFEFAAKLEISEWLLVMLDESKGESVYQEVVDMMHSDIMMRACCIFTHTSNETSNMVQLARLQARAQLYQRIVDTE